MSKLQMPSDFFWQMPAPELPLRAAGAIVMDSHGMTIANCPNSSYAEAVAYTINMAHGFPHGSPIPGQSSADDISSPPETKER